MGKDWREGTHEDSHLDTTLHTSALEDNIESISAPDPQIPHSRGSHLFTPCTGLVLVFRRLASEGHLPRIRNTNNITSKLELAVVDVDGGDAGGAEGEGERAREEADGAGADNAHPWVGRGAEVGSAGGVEDDGQWLCECCCVVRARVGDASGRRGYHLISFGESQWRKNSRMEKLDGVVHAALEGAVEMREGLCGGAEAHVLAEVVSRALGGLGAVGIALDAVSALLAGDADLEGDALTDAEVGW